MLDPKTDLSSHHFHNFNPPSGQGNDMNFSHIARKPAQNYDRTVQFRAGSMEKDESGVCSPPLWKASNYKNLSPESKAKAVARGQWELMEMAKNMPESCYELSLKDIVEVHRLQPQEGDCLAGEKVFGGNQRGKAIKRNEKKALMGRSRSVDSTGGLLLKMAFPFSLGSKKKKKLGIVTNSWWAVSARSDKALDGSCKGGVDREYWWKKRFSGWSDSEFGAITSCNSGRSSSSSSRSNSNSSSRKRSESCYSGCWSILSTKGKGSF